MNPNENDIKDYELGVMMMIMSPMLEITLIINLTTLHDLLENSKLHRVASRLARKLKTSLFSLN